MEVNSLLNCQSANKLKENFNKLKDVHMRKLLADEKRNEKCVLTFDNLVFDFTHEKLDLETLELLEKLAEERKVKEKFDQMLRGDKINITENRSVLHTALRRNPEIKLEVDGKNIMVDVDGVLQRIKKFSYQIRKGEKLGFTGKKLKNFISIGIGGSYLGPEFIYQSLKYHDQYLESSKGLNL